jgi:hypothetical protein
LDFGLAEMMSNVPFPPISEEIKTKFAVSNLSLYPFGWLEEDLNVDFNQKMRPYLETQILECCTRDSDGKKCDRNLFWELEMGTRTECLLILLTLGGASELILNLRCLNEVCREEMELELSIQELINLQRQSSDIKLMVQMGGDRVAIRKPIGLDQLQWLSQSFPDEKAAVQAMIQRLLIDDEKPKSLQARIVPDEWVQAIDRAMEDLDPLVNFTMGVNCPYCGTLNHYSLDLGELSLRKLRHAQENLLKNVYRLMSRFHWSEAEVFAVPAWRRSRYLALIEKEESQ